MTDRESRGLGNGLWERSGMSAMEGVRPGGGRRRVSPEEKAQERPGCLGGAGSLGWRSTPGISRRLPERECARRPARCEEPSEALSCAR